LSAGTSIAPRLSTSVRVSLILLSNDVEPARLIVVDVL
jgi:hypothetical protein